MYRYVLLFIKDMDDTNTASSMLRPKPRFSLYISCLRLFSCPCSLFLKHSGLVVLILFKLSPIVVF